MEDVVPQSGLGLDEPVSSQKVEDSLHVRDDHGSKHVREVDEGTKKKKQKKKKRRKGTKEIHRKREGQSGKKGLEIAC